MKKMKKTNCNDNDEKEMKKKNEMEEIQKR